MDVVEDKYSRLLKVKEKLLKRNLFTSASKEIADLEEAIDLVLEKDTDPANFNEEIQALHIKLNQCMSGKKRALSALDEATKSKRLRDLFNNKKIGIVGGHQKDRLKLKEYILNISHGAKIKFQETPPENVTSHRKFREKYSSVDIIIAITGYVGHALTNHVGMIEDEHKISSIYVEDLSDVDTLLNEIIQTLRFNS